jgi:hypothetical protein
MTHTSRSDDIRGLEELREKLVTRRRSIVSKLSDANGDSFSGETFSKIQSAIEAVDHAIIDEQELALQAGSQIRTSRESFRVRAGAA